jgi:RimJ/RimL family protein N-acetyltransferase
MLDQLQMPIETDGLLIREILDSDYLALDELYSDEEVRVYIGTSPCRPRPGETRENAFRRLCSSTKRPMAIARREGAFVGSLSLQPYAPDGEPAPGDFEVTIAILRCNRRAGIAKEVLPALFGALRSVPEVRRVVARVSPSNEASLRLVSSLGFARVGSQWDPYRQQSDHLFVLGLNDGAV